MRDVLRIVTRSKREAEGQLGLRKWHVISLRTTNTPKPDLDEKDWGSVTYLELPESDMYHVEEEKIAVITEAAMRAYDCAKAGSVAGLMVHCDMGVWRSVGVAKAIADALNLRYDTQHTGSAYLRKLVYEDMLAYMDRVAKESDMQDMDLFKKVVAITFGNREAA